MVISAVLTSSSPRSTSSPSPSEGSSVPAAGNTKEKKSLMINKESLKKTIDFLEFFGKPYCFHAGIGLYVRNFSAELDDIDVKVFHHDLEEIYTAAKLFFDCDIRLVEGGRGIFGEYLFPRVEIELDTPIDICTRTGVINDLGRFEFPFSADVFKNLEYFPYENLSLPTAPLESLFSYYLILRRGRKDNKNDEQKILEILNSSQFNKGKLFDLFENHEKFEDLKRLLDAYLK